MTPTEIDALKARIGDRLIIASVSGGKDSAAMRLHLREIGIPDSQVRNVACDTGWEWSGWREYVEGPLAAAIGPVTIIRASVKRTDLIDVSALRPRTRAAVEGDSAMVQLILRKMIFPGRTRRFCTEELKVKPMQKYINGLVDEGEDIVNAVGIRRRESLARSEMTEWEWSKGFDCEVWRPLVDWTVEDVIAIHQRHGLVPNPLYVKGVERVGCWPCISSSKAEIKLLASVDPERVALLRDLEADVDDAARVRFAERGEDKSELRTFFQAPIDRKAAKRWDIDRVVRWSRTMRGGRIEDRRVEFEIFKHDNPGCRRWNLCETAPEKGDEP